MSDENIVIMTGHIGGEPNFRTIPSGGEVCDISLASNRYSKAHPETGHREQHTTWCRVTCWKKQAVWVNENISVGDFVYVRGMLVDDDFKKRDGEETKGRLKIDNARVQLLKKKQVTGEQTEAIEAPVIPEVQ